MSIMHAGLYRGRELRCLARRKVAKLLLEFRTACCCSVNTVASYGQLLDAPSYQDATLFDAVEIRPSGGSDEPSGGGAPALPATSIAVDDPVRRTEQSLIPGVSGGYVSYRVTTKTALESFEKPEVSVRRRFRDFVV